MTSPLELIVSPPAGIDAAALDAVAPIRQAFARGPARIEPGDTADWWFRHFGVAREHDWPAAAFLGDSAAVQRFCADPVRLMVSGDAVVLDAGATADISAAEASAMTALLNRHFAADGMRFRADLPGHWLLECGSVIDATTVPTARVHGRSIESFLPQGPQARLLKRIGNECQMLLHDAAVNQEREAQGKAPVNGVWLWGGTTARPQVNARSGLLVATGTPWVKGLAQAAGASVLPMPGGAAELPAAGPLLVDLATSCMDPASWPDWFASEWLVPLRARGGPVRLTLALPGVTASADLFRIDPWRLLRRGGLAARLAAAGMAG